MKVSLLVCLLCMLACQPRQAPVPRPHAFPRVIYPEGKMVSFEAPDCPFTFRYPDYAQVEARTSFFGETPVSACWFDLHVPALKARVHFSYYALSEEHPYDDLVKDAFTIANKINQRSNYMDEIRVANAQGVHGLVMEFQGPAASPMHFYLTDSTDHFVKAALYYEAEVRPDSLAPINVFLKEDIAEIINTFDWR